MSTSNDESDFLNTKEQDNVDTLHKNSEMSSVRTMIEIPNSNLNPQFALVGTPRKGQTSSESGTDAVDVPLHSQTEEDKSNESEVSSRTEERNEVKRLSRRAQAALTRKTPVLIPDLKKRTAYAKDRMKTMQIKAHELTVTCGAQVYCKMQYVGGHKKTHEKEFGEDFTLEKDKISPRKNYPDSLDAIIQSAVNKSMKKHIPQLPRADPRGSHSRMVIGDTPTVPTTSKPRRKGVCDYCDQDSNNVKVYDHCGVQTKEIVTVVIACSFEMENGKFCPRSVHADCLGFPGVTAEKIEIMPDWYCKLHIAEGRKAMQVTTAPVVAGHSGNKNQRPKKSTKISKKKMLTPNPTENEDSESSAVPASSPTRERSPIKKRPVKAKKVASDASSDACVKQPRGRPKKLFM